MNNNEKTRLKFPTNGFNVLGAESVLGREPERGYPLPKLGADIVPTLCKHYKHYLLPIVTLGQFDRLSYGYL